MSGEVRRIPFRVDVAGVIHIMGSALYSRPEAAVRELLQNAHDAVMRRRQRDLSYRGRIDILQDPRAHELRFVDDGIGLTADEAEQYLGTLGIGITGLMKGQHPSAAATESGDGEALIGQFGIGLFSAFMLADRIIVESRRADQTAGVRWSAGEGTEIEIAPCPEAAVGTTVRLQLKPRHYSLADRTEPLEEIVKEYADFLPIPIFINQAKARCNVIHSAWFDPTPDCEAIELELASYFSESPLDVIPLQISRPVRVCGALYITPRRMPGFAGEPVVTATVRHMAISRRIQGLLPEWASFLRGVLELPQCNPTASRDDLVHDASFDHARAVLEERVHAHLEHLASADPARLQSILAWHRYSLAGASLSEPRLRGLLRRVYRFPTSHGLLSFAEIIDRSRVDPILESEYDRVIWYNTDRRQERWISSLFAQGDTPCVHALRSFEESLLAALAADDQEAATTDLRFATPSSRGFASEILGVHDVAEAPAEWQEFLDAAEARIMCAAFRADQPVMAFLNEKHELLRTFDDLKQQGAVPAGFQRLIDSHLSEHQSAQNEVLLNTRHRLVARALEQKTSSPLASVLRLLVLSALGAAGGTPRRMAQQVQADDLDWIADALWGRNAAQRDSDERQR